MFAHIAVCIWIFIGDKEFRNETQISWITKSEQF